MARVPVIDGLRDDIFRMGLETAGTVTAYAGEAYSTGGSAAPTITNYTFDGSGQFTQGETLSFAGLGVTSAFFPFFASPDKAYLYDSANRRLIAWSPSAMELRNTIIGVSVEVDNITDTLVQDDYGVQRPGRSFWAKVSIVQ